MKRILIFFFILTVAFVNFAYAEEVPRLPQGDFSELRQTGIAQVVNVIDPQTIQLEDGHVVRLSGIDLPDFQPEEPGDFSMTALKILRDMLVGKTIIMYQTVDREEGRINRMGQDIAQIERQSDKAWVQGTLLTLGLARTRTAQRNPEMAQQMYDLEQKAMEQKLGIWEKYKILTPEEVEGKEGTFQIVEGRIRSAALKQNRVYLNFGGDWKTDFTVSIAPEDKRIFSKQKLDPLQWNGKSVRLRGWIESYNGPYMQINHPEAIELMVDEKINTASPAPDDKSAPPSPAPSLLPEGDQLPKVGK